MLVPEPLPGPAKAADDLIYDQERAVLFADLFYGSQVLIVGNEYPAAGNDRLYDHAGDCLGQFPGYDPIYLPRALQRAGVLVGTEVAAVGVPGGATCRKLGESGS